jgi:hypothetical protein
MNQLIVTACVKADAAALLAAAIEGGRSPEEARQHTLDTARRVVEESLKDLFTGAGAPCEVVVTATLS